MVVALGTFRAVVVGPVPAPGVSSAAHIQSCSAARSAADVQRVHLKLGPTPDNVRPEQHHPHVKPARVAVGQKVWFARCWGYSV